VLKHIDKSNNVFTGYADMSFTTTTFYANFSHNEFAGVSLRRFNAAYQTLKVVDLSYNNISQDASKIFDDVPPNINSLPAKSCYGGEKKSVLLAKHKDTNIPTMIKVNEKLIYFHSLSNYFNNRSPTIGNDSQHGMH